MSEATPLHIFLRFCGVSLLAVGGATAALPEAHRQLVGELGWLSDSQFSQIFAIAQTSPGPNVIVFSLFGWTLAGFWGLLAATLGILGPASLLAFAMARMIDRAQGAAWVGRLKRALIPLAIGLMAANGFLLAQGADQGADQGALTAAITLGATAFVAFSSKSPLWAMAVAAAAAICAGRLGLL